MDFSATDTIAAVATPPGASERSVVRLTGPGAIDVLARACRTHADWANGRHANAAVMARSPDGTEVAIPCALHVWRSGRSYTGQASVEVQLPGSAPLVELALQSLYQAGARPAQRGEFTLRAFLTGKLDLTQAEAVLGTIDANDHVELEQSLRQLAGGLSGKIHTLRETLLIVLADLEAGLDFVDEDIEFIERSELLARLEEVRQAVAQLQADSVSRMHANECPRIVLIGPPNAGKSSLFNLLLARDAAIVSPQAGTTRDYVAGRTVIFGQTIELVDTAGHDASTTAIERHAQDFREDRTRAADLILRCHPIDQPSEYQSPRNESLGETQTVDIITKADLLDSTSDNSAIAHTDRPAILISVKTSQGIEALRRRIHSELERQPAASAELIGATAARAADSLRRASESLQRAYQVSQSNILGDEFVALEIRSVLEALGEIVGAVYTDDILDRVFSRFCIGK